MPGLLDLPAEIRLTIYRLVIPNVIGLCYSVPTGSRCAILQSCHQLREEIFQELFCNNIFVHQLVGWRRLNDLVVTRWTSRIRHLCVELSMDTLESLEDEHSVPKGAYIPSYSSWLSKQQTRIAKWLARFESLQTLELRVCMYQDDGAEMDFYLMAFFGSIDTSAEIAVSNGFGGHLEEDVCREIAENLNLR